MKSLSAALLLLLSAGLFAVELTSLKNVSDWIIRFPVKRHQTYKLIQYSRKEGSAAEITAVPNVFKYTELLLKEPVAIAEKQEEFEGAVSIRLKADNTAGFVAVSARFEDRAGEVRQFQKIVKLRPGQFETVRIPAGWNVRPERVWGNRDKNIDYPVRFTGLKFDYNPAVSSLKLTMDDLKWENLKK